MSMLVLRRLLMGLMLVLLGQLPKAHHGSLPWKVAAGRLAHHEPRLVAPLVPHGFAPHVVLQTPYPVEFVQQRKQKKLAQSRAILFKVTPLDQDITYTNAEDYFY
jgi:hypothetical protein